MGTTSSSAVQFAPKARILVAPAGTAGTLPVDVTAVIPPAFKELGYTDAAGIELTPKLDSTPIEAHQSATPIKYVVKAASAVLKFQMLQWDDDTVGLYFGATLTTDSVNKVKKLVLESTPSLIETCMIVEWGDYTETNGTPNVVTGTKNRLVIPRGMVDTKDPIKLSRTDVQSLGIQFSALDSGGQLGYLLTGPTA